MTVNTISSIAEFVTNGVTTNYPFYFKFLANEDLVVTYISPAGVSSVLKLGTHYTVNGVGTDGGGSIATATALAGPGQLVVSREMDAFQQTSLRNQGKFLAETHEDVFDRLTMLIQQGFAIFKRALTRPFGRDYFFAENRRIASVADPVDMQDAATKRWALTAVADLISRITGNANLASNVFYQGPDGLPHVLQELADASAGASLVRGAAKYLSSIAELRAEPGFYDGQRVLVDSYYADSSGVGGGLFRWFADSTIADEGGAYIKCASVATGRWHRVFAENYVSAAMWGMKRGLTTNQIDPAKKAIAYAAANAKQFVALVPGDVYISLETNPAYFGAGLILPNGVFLDLRGTKLRALATTSAGYSVVLIKEDCLYGGVIGGEIVGDLDSHLGTTGEFGMGINVRAAKNIFISDIRISKCWGDGLYLGADTNGDQTTHSEEIHLHNVTCDQNRRNGCSIVNAKNVYGTGRLSFTNTIGTSPEAGIDIEPDAGGICENIQLDNVYCYNNKGSGFMTFSTASDPLVAPSIVGLHVGSLVSEKNGGLGCQLLAALEVTISSAAFRNNLNKGLTIEACADVEITEVKCRNNRPTGQFQRGDVTITRSSVVNIGSMISRYAAGPSALIVRGSSDVNVGSCYVNSSGLTQAAIQVEVECDAVKIAGIKLHDLVNTGIYVDSSCVAVKLIGDRLKNVGRGNSNAVLIQNQAAGTTISGFHYSSEAPTKPFSGIVSSGDRCIIVNNIIPASQIGGGSAQAINVTGANVINNNNITA